MRICKFRYAYAAICPSVYTQILVQTIYSHFYRCPQPNRCHGLSWPIQTCCAIDPLCTGTRQKGQLYLFLNNYDFYIYLFRCYINNAVCLGQIIYVKVKWSSYRPGVAQRVGRGIALLFHDRDTRRGWVVSSTPRPHFTPGKDPVPIVQEAGWATGPVWTGGKSRPQRDSIPNRPVRSQSLYRLNYRDIMALSKTVITKKYQMINPLNDELNATCHWLA